MATDPETVSSSPKTRKVSIFSWSEVDPEIIRGFLEAAYKETGQLDLVPRIAKFSDRRLELQAELTLGTPPKKRFHKILVDVALQDWLDIAPSRTVRELATIVQASTHGPARGEYIGDKSSAMGFLFRRKRTHNFEVNVRKFFVNAHKISYENLEEERGDKGLRQGSVTLVGEGAEAPFSPYQHQIEARIALDKFYKNHSNRNKGALIVLPTGAGKTEVMVEWLLDKIVADARQLLSDLVIKVLGPDENAKVRHIVATGRAYEEVLKLAKSTKASLIVVGTHTANMADYLLGPNAARIVRHADCSVYVVR
jgi:nucleotide-binding universal stress UspA family protein